MRPKKSPADKMRPFVIYMPEDLKKLLAERARYEYRSMSSLINLMAIHCLEECENYKLGRVPMNQVHLLRGQGKGPPRHDPLSSSPPHDPGQTQRTVFRSRKK